MVRDELIVGQTYRDLMILSEITGSRSKRYNVRCSLCGQVFTETRYRILRNTCGCVHCRLGRFHEQKRKNMERKYVGKRYGQLTIVAASGYLPYGRSHEYFVKVKCDCGEIREYPFFKVKEGRIRSCGHKINVECRM